MGNVISHLRTPSQKKLAEKLKSLTGRLSLWAVWKDFICMTACSISSTVDAKSREGRERQYRECADRYTDAELEIFAELYADLVEALEFNPDQDLLGELFMGLNLGNEWKGQFFTPYNVCKLMATVNKDDLEATIEANGFSSVCDPACGAGAILIAYANECKRRGINYQQFILFAAQDIDAIAGMMCYIQLSLLGCPGYVKIDDTLSHPLTAYDEHGLLPADDGTVWYTPMFCTAEWACRRVLAMQGKKANKLA